MANIYELISTISKEAGALAPESKGGVPFAFRGIDGTVAHLAPLLQKYGVVTVPVVHERTTTMSPSGNKVVTTTDLLASYRFYAPDGTFIEATTAGLANDYADRSAAQAQSVAFRVALLQTFFLPTHTKEPEQTGVEPEAPKKESAKASSPVPTVNSLRGEVSAYLGTSDFSKIAAEGKKFFKGHAHEADWADSVEALQEWVDNLKEGK